MTDLNQVVLIGRIVRDLDERSFAYVGNGQARAVLSVAVNRSKKVGENWENDVSYFDVTIWGKQAESLKPYLSKGKQIAIEGYLKQDRWEKDGQKLSKVAIVANNVQLLGGKDTNGDNPATIQPKANKNAPANVQNLAAAVGGEVQEDFPEDIPF